MGFKLPTNEEIKQQQEWFDARQRVRAAAPALLAACEAAKHVWEQGCVDRGWKDEPNWIDEAKELIDAAIAQAKGDERC